MKYNELQRLKTKGSGSTWCLLNEKDTDEK
jgi:hypothetical protein